LERLSGYGAGGAEPDPLLSVLDGALTDRLEQQSNSPSEPIDLDRLDFETKEIAGDSQSTKEISTFQRSRSIRRRGRKSRRREITLTVAATALVLFSAALFLLTGSCVGQDGSL
jgi:hypothetical protein